MSNTLVYLSGAIGEACERARERVSNSPSDFADAMGADLRRASQEIDRYLSGTAIDLTEQTLIDMLHRVGR